MLPEERHLWDQYTQDRSVENRNRLAEFYLPAVTRLAENRLHTLSVTANLEVNDLLADAMPGLFQAIERFDVTRKLKFMTFAALRLNGSMLDAIRELDWVPRLDRERRKKNADLPDPVTMTSLREFEYAADNSDQIREPWCLAIEDSPDPKGDIFWRWICKGLLQHERLMLMMYHRLDMKMKEIGQNLGLSESRISQTMASIYERIANRSDIRDPDSQRLVVDPEWRPRSTAVVADRGDTIHCPEWTHIHELAVRGSSVLIPQRPLRRRKLKRRNRTATKQLADQICAYLAKSRPLRAIEIQRAMGLPSSIWTILNHDDRIVRIGRKYSLAPKEST